MTLLHPVWLLLAVPLGVSLLLWRLPSRFLQGLLAGLGRRDDDFFNARLLCLRRMQDHEDRGCEWCPYND